MFTLVELLESLQVEQLDSLLFRGYSLKLPLPRVFGGQVLAQSINAASRTVDASRVPHSFHAYFLRPGNPDQAIIFDIDPIRDGGSFTTRRVVAKQNGKAIFNCSISYQTVEEGFEHQIAIPEGVPLPEPLPDENERLQKMLDNNEKNVHPFLLPSSVIDVRQIDPINHSNPITQEPVQGYWFKFIGPLDDNPATHQTLLTYMSDYGLMSTGLRPHAASFLNSNLQAASLDHAMWFHEDFRVDEWIYYHMDSPRSGRGRDFNRGSFYTYDGRLVVSCAQEGLVRLRE